VHRTGRRKLKKRAVMKIAITSIEDVCPDLGLQIELMSLLLHATMVGFQLKSSARVVTRGEELVTLIVTDPPSLTDA
jgi:hypothetical protein